MAGPGYQQPTKIEYIHLTASLLQMIKWNTTGQRMRLCGCIRVPL